MSKLLISTGTTPNDNTGDTLLDGAIKINSNFNEIYDAIGNSSDINIGVGKTILSTNNLGYVGVGTTNALENLHVHSFDNTDIQVSSSKTDGYSEIYFKNDINEEGWIWYSGSTRTNADEGGPNALHVWNAANAPLSLGTNSEEKLRITGSGNVGIGTTNPISQLHISSGPVVINSSSLTGTSSQNLQVNSGAYFNGSIGIGTTNPSAKLHLSAGTATANSSPLKFTSGTKLTTIESGSIEYDGTTLYATPSTNFGRASIPTTIFTSGTGTSGITGSTNYAIFPAANDTITLPVGTYLVKMRVRVSVTGATATSSLNINLRGAGNAVGSFSWGGTGSILDSSASSSFIVAATALGTNIAVTATSAANPRQYNVLGEGILKVTTQGTIIPAYQFSTTLTGGSVTLVTDNYMVIQSLDTSGSATYTGAWS